MVMCTKRTHVFYHDIEVLFRRKFVYCGFYDDCNVNGEAKCTVKKIILKQGLSIDVARLFFFFLSFFSIQSQANEDKGKIMG